MKFPLYIPTELREWLEDKKGELSYPIFIIEVLIRIKNKDKEYIDNLMK